MPSPDPPPGSVPRAAGAVLEIDLDAIAGNWRRLAAGLAPGTLCAGVVKADAYGLGAAAVAPALAAAGCTLFFVATLDEGMALRRILPAAEIAVLNGLLAGTEADFAAHRLLPVLNDPGEVDAWRDFAASRGGLPAMLQLDTGMSRLGLTARETARLGAAPERLRGFPLRAVLSHLACADMPDHPMNPAQLADFRAARALLPTAPASLAASSGIFLGADFHFDLVRPGAALYGVNPHPSRPNPMRQVFLLKGRILQVREIDRGRSVGYGAAHLMDRPGRVATVAVGYADGWLRSAGGRGSVDLAGRRVPIIGRISMDLMTLDVTGIDPALARPGAFVELIGDGNPVDRVAANAGTIGYEILTTLGRRYHRVHRGVGHSSGP